MLATLALLCPLHARAQSGRDLASPWGPERAGSEAPAVLAEVQELSVIGPSSSTHEYGDGGGEALAWDDAELDLDPRGRVHFVLGGRFVYVPGDAGNPEGLGGGGDALLDFCLVPEISLHLRVGLAIGAHGTLVPGPLRGLIYFRPMLLLGVHLLQRISIRIGGELGPELVPGGTVDFVAPSGAALLQLGVRPVGRFELALELGADVWPGETGTAPSRVSSFRVSPRVGAILQVTF
jgi:hypothetical protein